MSHVVLLGDSIFDNGVYVPGGPAVIEQLRSQLPRGWRATLLAIDGAVVEEVASQLARLPDDASHLVISAGGNDALQSSHIVEDSTRSAADGFAHAAEVLSGTAMGRRSRTDFRRAVQVSTIWALAFALLSSLIFWALGEQIIALFSDIADVRLTALDYLPWMIVLPLIAVWSFQLDGIFVGTTRSAEMRNAMIVSLLVYLATCWLLIPTLSNDGLWLSLLIFMAARTVTLGLYLPRLERAIAGSAA